MPENTIEIKFVASGDQGVVTATKNVQEAVKNLGDTHEETKKKTDHLTDSTGGFEEMIGVHTTRAVSLLTRGIASELDPALARLIGRINAATLGVRLLGEGLSIPMMIGIGTAIAGLTLFIGKINEAAQRQATLNIAIRGIDVGTITSKMAELNLALRENEERAKTWSGTVINEFARAAREITNFQKPSAILRGAAQFGDWIGDLLGLPGQSGANKYAFMGGADPLVTKAKEAEQAFLSVAPQEYLKTVRGLIVALDQLKVAQAAIPLSLGIQQSLSIAEEATQRYARMSREIRATAEAQKALNEEISRQDIARFGASAPGGPKGPAATLFAALEASTLTGKQELVTKGLANQLQGLQSELTRAIDPVYTALTDQARAAGFTIGRTLGASTAAGARESFGELSAATARELTGLQAAQQARQFMLQNLALLDPAAASTQGGLLTAIMGARAVGMNVPLPGFAPGPGGTIGGLQFDAGNTFIQQTRLVEEFQTRLARQSKEALARGGPSAQAEQDAVNAFEQRGVDFGLSLSTAQLEGFRKVVQEQRGIGQLQVIIESWATGFSKSVQEEILRLAPELKSLGFSAEFIENTVIETATSRVRERAAGAGEEAMIAKLFGGIMENVVARFEAAGAGKGGLGTIVSQRMVSLITKEIGRAGLDPDFITSEVIMAMIKGRQARTQLGIVQEASMAEFLAGSADRVIAAFRIGVGEGFKQKIEEGIRQHILESGLSGFLSEAMIAAMTGADWASKQGQLLQTGAIAPISQRFSEERLLRQFAANMGLLGFGGQAGVTAITSVEKDVQSYFELTGRHLTDAQERGLEAGIRQTQEDTARGIEIKAFGVRSLVRTIAGDAETIKSDAKSLGLKLYEGVAEGVAAADAAGKGATLSVRLATALLDSRIAVSGAAAQVGLSAGEQLFGGIEHGLLTFAKGAGSLGENISKVIGGVGSSMSRAMDDTFFNIITGQVKKLPDVFKQLGEGIVREFTKAISQFTVGSMFKSIADALRGTPLEGLLGGASAMAIIPAGSSGSGGGGFQAGSSLLARLLGFGGGGLGVGAGGFESVFGGEFGNLVGGSAGAFGGGLEGGATGIQGSLSSLTGLSQSTLSSVGGGISSAAGAAFGVLGLVSAFQQGGIRGAISGAVSGATLGGQFFGPWGALIGGIAGFFVGIFGGGEARDKKRVADKQTGFNKWLQDLDALQTFDELDFFLDHLHWEAVPGNERVARFLGNGHPVTTRDRTFSPENDLQWNAGVFLNLNAVPDFIARGSAAIRQKIAQVRQVSPITFFEDGGHMSSLQRLQEEERRLGITPGSGGPITPAERLAEDARLAAIRISENATPGGLFVEDVIGDITRSAVFGGTVGSLEQRFAEARRRSSMVEIFLSQLQDEALAERLIMRLRDAAEKIDLKLTPIKPFQLPEAFA